MKNILFIIAIICIALVSCDGRKSKTVALKESIEEFNQKQSNFEMISYYPKEYTEVVTDTIISDELKISIKNYSLENAALLMSSSKQTTQKDYTYHRVFESKIVVSTSTKTIYSGYISAARFKETSTDKFWNNATLQHAWVNQDLSTAESAEVDVSFINPEDNSYKLLRISIGTDGRQQINLIEENS